MTFPGRAPAVIGGCERPATDCAWWREAFANNDGAWFCFCVERPDGELVGFAKGRKSDGSEFGGELNKIYLLHDYQRLGLGRQLVGRVARRFLSQGITSMWLRLRVPGALVALIVASSLIVTNGHWLGDLVSGAYIGALIGWWVAQRG